MSVINAAYKRYNANSRGKDVGDCVKRSLSFAFKMDYDEVSRILNKIKRDINAYAFNSRATFTKFLKDRGSYPIKLEEKITEEQFCEEHPSGVYICLSGSEQKGYSTHMVCIMNGDIYDSWNSSEYIVYEYFEIKDIDTKIEDVYFLDIEDEIMSFLNSYIDKINKKYSKYMKVYIEKSWDTNDTTKNIRVCVALNKDIPANEKWYYNEYTPGTIYRKNFVLKLNPRLNADKNLESLKTKTKERIYNWIYNFQKEMRDQESVKSIKTHPKFNGDPRLLLKLPEWSRELVYYLDYNPRVSWDKIELGMKALPGDPRAEEENDRVWIRAEDWKEATGALEAYKKDFSRLGYDY